MTALRSLDVTHGLPRLVHVERHVRQLSGPRLSAVRLAVLRGLLTPRTLDDIAAALSMSRRGVEYHVPLVYGAMGAGGMGRHELARLAILRIAAGIDPCWCEVEP